MTLNRFVALTVCATLTACGGGGSGSSSSPIVQIPTTTAPPTTPTPAPAPAPAPITGFTKITSTAIQNAFINWEALSVADINRDNKLDIVMANGSGGLTTPMKSIEPPTTILVNDGANRFTRIDTSGLKPTGWVNDWVILPTPDGGNPYIFGIDHGRESPTYMLETKMKMPIYRIEEGKIIEYTDKLSNNNEEWRHAANQIGDLNKDGYPDFVVANSNMDQAFSVYFGEKQNIFIPQNFGDYSNVKSSKFIGIAGATAILDVGGDGDLDFIVFPYVKAYGEHRNAEIFLYQNGALSEVKTFIAKSSDIPDNAGYSFTAIADLNKDGLSDIVAVLEIGGATKNTIAVMLQTKLGSFEIKYFSTSEFKGHADSKTQLYDMDADGDLDIIYGGALKNVSTDLSKNLFLNDGNGSFVLSEAKNQEIFKSVNWDGYARTFVSDFNGDGLGDVLVLQESYVSGVQTITPMVFINSGKFG